MRARIVLGLSLIAAALAGCSSSPYPTDIELMAGDVGCEVDHADQRWVVGPVPDGGTLAIEPDLGTFVSIARQGDQLTIRTMRGLEGSEATTPVTDLNRNWEPDDWTIVHGESFRPVSVRCWQQP